MVHIRKKNSVHVAMGDALGPLAGPDSLIVDKDAFLLTNHNGYGATLTGSWTITVNGKVECLAADAAGLQVRANNSLDSTTLRIGSTGQMGGYFALDLRGAGTIVNHGLISGDAEGAYLDTTFGNIELTNAGRIRGGSEFLGAAIHTRGDGTVTLNNSLVISDPTFFAIWAEPNTISLITNWGTMKGQVLLGDAADHFTNFKKIGKITKHGIVTNLIDLGGGADEFDGGKHNEVVRGGSGNDIVNLGGGKDTYSAVINDDNDTIKGGGGTDTYDLGATQVSVTVNLDSIDHNSFPFQTAASSVFITSVVGFENVTGGGGADALYGSAASNVINGLAGGDHIYGFGGRDILTGSADNDSFHFTALKDSGVAENKRDVITDFVSGSDHIVLEEIDANSKTPGVDDAFHLTANGGQHKFTHDPGELRIEKPKGLTVISGDVNGDGKADFSIALKGHIALVDTDFVL